MECPFVVGDEVVCIRMDSRPSMEGRTYTVTRVYAPGEIVADRWGNNWRATDFGLWVSGEKAGDEPGDRIIGFDVSRFRKVQKPTRSIEQWLTQPVPNTDQWDKSKEKV